jgi:hypothetical protein
LGYVTEFELIFDIAFEKILTYWVCFGDGSLDIQIVRAQNIGVDSLLLLVVRSCDAFLNIHHVSDEDLRLYLLHGSLLWNN